MRFVLAFAMLLGGCGYVGDPLPPALKIPVAVTDLAVKQVGENLLVSFTIPAKTLEGLELDRLGGVELKVGANTPAPFQADAWSSGAKVVDVTATAPGKVDARVPVKDWVNQEIVFGVRVANVKKRVSQWSNFAVLKVKPVLEAPANFRAAASATGVDLDWSDAAKRPGLEWRLYRLAPDEKEATELATVTEAKFRDTGAQYDTLYKYTIVAIEGKASSEMSEPVTIRPVDTFAPVTPLGLSALAAPAAVQLSWERNQEPDLGLYRVFRAVDGGELVKVFESPSAANFRDNDVKPGQAYRYAISAVDKKGNESPKSETVEIRLP